MVRITFFDPHGKQHDVSGQAGSTVMHAAVDNSVSGIDAECGGSCACGTCHVYVQDGWLESLRAPSADERALLEGLVLVEPNSRLSCQIEITPELNGLVLRIPRAEY